MTTTTAPAYGMTRAEARLAPWNVMAGGLTMDHTDVTAAMIEAGIDYDTRMVEVTTVEGLEVPNHRAVVRPRPGGQGEMAVAVTGTRYTPIQNRDAFAVAGDLTREFGARIVGAADYRSGGATIMVVALGEPVVLDRPDGGTDEVDLNLLIKNAHDGSSALTFALTGLRVACTNAVQAAIRGAQRTWKISHTPNAQERVNLAHQAILNTVTYRDAFQEAAQALIAETMTDLEFQRIVERMWPVAEGREDTRAGRNAMETRAKVLDLYHTSETLEGLRGTMWGGVNALTEFYDWGRDVRGGDVSRAEGALDGPYVRRKAAAWDQFLAAV